MKSKVPETAIVAFIVLLSSRVDAQPDSPETLIRFSKGEPILEEMFPGESAKPPYKIETWVESLHGLHEKGSKRIIEDCLHQELRA